MIGNLNLSYFNKNFQGKFDNIFWNTQKTRACGIVYCRTRDTTSALAESLTQKGIPTKAYHAGLKDKERAGVQDEWMSGKIPVITATISFGMGVDKASVR